MRNEPCSTCRQYFHILHLITAINSRKKCKSEPTSKASKTFDILNTLFWPVTDDLQFGAKLLVVVGKPFEQRLVFDEFQFNSSLKWTDYTII